MCGIAGFFNKHKVKDSSLFNIIEMVRIQSHRGPDDNGICAISSDRNLVSFDKKELDLLKNSGEEVRNTSYEGAFGFCRLSILDLTYCGHQPMLNKEKNVMIVYNGEVYNAFDYKDELINKGYSFNSATDTEILLNLYLEYGIKWMAKQLNGMFAFAICDMRKEKIFLVRDRLGIKPLYFYNDNNVFLFASEMKSIIFSGKMEAILDIDAAIETVAFGNSLKKTLIKGVCIVEAGSVLEYDLNNDELQTSLYFDINNYRRSKRRVPLTTIKSEAENVLEQSVKRQLRSDVKIGCQLSGGVDSSTVSYYASRDDKVNLKDGIAVVFHNEYSEEKYINKANKILKFDVHKCVLDETFFLQNVEKICWHLDGIPSYYNEIGILLLSEEAKKHVSVLLSGEGADELFCGYSRMAASDVISKASRISRFLPKSLKRKLWGDIDQYNFDGYVLFKDAIPESVMEKVFCNGTSSKRKNLLQNAAIDRQKKLKNFSGSNIDRQIKYEISVRLPGLLNRQDKSTMAYSIENRVPYLDNEMIDFSFQIPIKHLIKMNLKTTKKYNTSKIQGKYFLKKVCADLFSEEFAFRRKGGFEVPVNEWMKNVDFVKFIGGTIIPSMNKRGVIDGCTIKEWINNIDTISEKEMVALWRCIGLEIFARLFVDKVYGKEPFFA